MSSFSYCKYPWNDEKQWQFQASPLLRMFQNHLFTRLYHKHNLKLCLCSSFSRFTNAQVTRGSSPPGASKAHHLAAALEGCYFVAGAPAQKNRSSGAPITANPSWQISDLHKVTIPFRPSYQELASTWCSDTSQLPSWYWHERLDDPCYRLSMLPFWALFSCEAKGYTNTAAFMVEAICCFAPEPKISVVMCGFCRCWRESTALFTFFLKTIEPRLSFLNQHVFALSNWTINYLDWLVCPLKITNFGGCADFHVKNPPYEQAICLFTQSSRPVQATVTTLVAGVDTCTVANQPRRLQT